MEANSNISGSMWPLVSNAAEYLRCKTEKSSLDLGTRDMTILGSSSFSQTVVSKREIIMSCCRVNGNRLDCKEKERSNVTVYRPKQQFSFFFIS